MKEPQTWSVTITFREHEDATRADACLHVDGMELEGWGRSRRNPIDPDVPMIGEEVAAARALSDLAHHLLERAAHNIETWEPHPAQLTA